MTACIAKCMVFINKGAGNFPISSPNNVLLYKVKNVLKVYQTSMKNKVFKTSAADIGLLEEGGSFS
uniref:Triose phosphate/phosphate translocator non-green plastid n=1 Tax=Rhizophora mucronata TaxID=61149 RepID=A0A2P2M5W2_RHIMU